MKKFVIILIMILLIGVFVCGCSNVQYMDTNWYFNKAIINVGNETIVVDVVTWRDYEDGEQLQITAKDGTVYLTSSYNCTLVYEEEK